MKPVAVIEGSSLQIMTIDSNEEEEDVAVHGQALFESFPSVIHSESNVRPAPFVLTPQAPPTSSMSFHEGSFSMNVGIEDFWGSNTSLYNELLPQESIDITNTASMKEPSQVLVNRLSPVPSVTTPDKAASTLVPTPQTLSYPNAPPPTAFKVNEEEEEEEEELQRKDIASALAQSFGKEFEETVLLDAIGRVANRSPSNHPHSLHQKDGDRNAIVEILPVAPEDDESSLGSSTLGKSYDVYEYGTIPPLLDQPSAVPEQQEDEEEELEIMSPLPVFTQNPNTSAFNDTSIRTSATSLYSQSNNETQDQSSMYSHLKDADRLVDYLDNNWPADISALDLAEEQEQQGYHAPYPSTNDLMVIEENDELTAGVGMTTVGSFRGSPHALTTGFMTSNGKGPSPQSSRMLESPHGSVVSLGKEKSEVFDSNALFAMSLLGDDFAEDDEEAMETGFDDGKDD